MIIENILSLFGDSTSLNNKIYILGILTYLILHIFFQLGSVKKNKLTFGIVFLGALFYLQFGINKMDYLGSHTHLELETLNSDVMTSKYKSNLYYLLGVKRCSSSKEIQFRFKKLSKLLHPDRKTKPLELKKNKVHITYEGK